MRILLIGPCPPPHGGISVHVSEIQRRLTSAGIPCANVGQALSPANFTTTLFRYACQGWTLHLHTNGHNAKSWLLALACAFAALPGTGLLLTLHSGMTPTYLGGASFWRRRMAALACRLGRRIICVSPAIRDAVIGLGVPPARAEVLPAYVTTPPGSLAADAAVLPWIRDHRPLITTVLSFRPEYGFDVLIAGLGQLRERHPSLGCLVMGSGEQRSEAEARIREAGLEKNVLLLGDVDHDACLALMSCGDAFVRPTFADGDSISVREALSLGIPVVASRTGTRPAGVLLFSPGDASEMASMLEIGLARGNSRQPSCDGCMDRLMEIYRQQDSPAGSLCPT